MRVRLLKTPRPFTAAALLGMLFFGERAGAQPAVKTEVESQTQPSEQTGDDSAPGATSTESAERDPSAGEGQPDAKESEDSLDAQLRRPSPLPTGEPRGRIYTLAQLLQLAETNYPKVLEARARLQRKRGELWEARTAPFMQWKVDGGIGVAPTVRGTSVYSPSSDVALTKNMALAWEVGVQGLLPLWTFGKITNLWEAAEANVEVGRHEVKKEKNEIRMEVRRAYYGVLLARDSRILLQRAMRRLDEYIVELQEKVKAGDADDIELLKIQMQRAELVARGTDADKGEAKALAGLKFFTGVTGGLDVPNEPLAPIEHALGPIAKYLEAARLHRPEVNMVRAGITARRAQVQLAKAKFYPDFGLGMTATLQRAPEVTDQRNPFTRDPGNRAFYGLGVVFRWNLDLLPQAARLAQAQANLEEVRATERYALGGIATEVEISHAEALAAKERLDAWADAAEYAKRWMIKVQQGRDLGLFDDEEIVEPSKAYALKKASEMEALYDYNLALARLAQTTGWEAMLR